MNTSKVVGITFAALAALFALGWIAQGNEFFLYKVFAPKYEEVRRQTYEQTKSYRQGSVQRLGTLCTQAATAQDKTLLNGVIKHEFAEWNVADVPAHLQSCLASARDQ